MSVIHVRQIKSSLEKEFASSINLEDAEQKSKSKRESIFLSRGLAALAIKILTEIPSEEAARSVTDGWQDNGLDAIYYHSQERILYVVQAKWKRNGSGSIERGEAQKFIKGFQDLVNARFERFNNRIKLRKQEIEDSLEDARTRFMLVIAHTGQQGLSDVVQRDFQDLLDELNDTSEIVTLRELRQSNLHSAVVLGMQGEPINIDVAMHEWGQTQDPYRAYYGQVAATDIAEWWNRYYPRLFSPNIRMFLGDTSVNETLIETLAADPEKFWYFNNGITALCTSIEKKPLGGGARQTGLFECRDFRIVNGAQTAGAIASAASKYLANVAHARVPIRVISLENSPENLEREITRYNNTQNRIERRDFAALDPEQERIRTELQLEEVSYTYKSGELMSGEVGCDLADAIVARACEQSDLSYAVQAKREIGRLWEDTDKAPYKVLFNSNVSGLSVWKSVQTLRVIDDELKNLERDSDDGRNRLLAIHGNRFIAHLVFCSSKNELDEQDLELSDTYRKRIENLTQEVYTKLTKAVNDLYPDSYLASLFKNGRRCQAIKDKYLESSSVDEPSSQAPTLQEQFPFLD